MRDGQLMVVPEDEGEGQAMYAWYADGKGSGTNSNTECTGCH